MDRRDFFKVIGLTSAALAIPKVVFAAATKTVPSGAVILSEVRRDISYRLDLDAWQIYYVKTIGEGEWYVSMLWDIEPDENALSIMDDTAAAAFSKALRMN